MFFIVIGMLFLIDALLIYRSTKKINSFRLLLFALMAYADFNYYSIGGEIERFSNGLSYQVLQNGSYVNMTYPSQDDINEYIAYKQMQYSTFGLVAQTFFPLMFLGLLVIIYDIMKNAGYIRE